MVRIARSWAFAEFFAYLLLTVVATWPLAGRFAEALPLGTETAATVPLFTTWTVWWNADRASRAYRDYWDAPIFHPAADAIAFSEPLSTTLAVAPLLWLTGNRILAHNAFLLLALILNGWSACLLLRRVCIGRLASAFGGALVVLLPMVHHELGVLQLVPVCGILWTIHGLHQYGKRPGAARAIWLGVAFSVTYLTCAYYGLFLSVLLILGGGWLLGGQLLRTRTWSRFTIAAAVILALAGPVVAVQLRVAGQHGLFRSAELVARLSAELGDYGAIPWPPMIRLCVLRGAGQEADFPLCPGIAKYALALIGTCAGLARRRFRYWTAFCLTVLGCALVLSLGPQFRLAGWSPYTSLMDWYPGFAQARSAFRFAMFVQLMTVLLAAIGLDELRKATGRIVSALTRSGSSPRNLPRLRRVIGAGCMAAVATVALVEILPARQAMYAPPSFSEQQAWIRWVATETPEDSVLAFLPFPEGGSPAAYEQSALWMYWQTWHHRRMLNGYSGFLPENYLETRRQLSGFPDESSLRRLRQQGATYCVIRRSFRTRTDVERNVAARRQLHWVYGDGAAMLDVYRLDRGDQPEHEGPSASTPGSDQESR